jgi:hypothetical protein
MINRNIATIVGDYISYINALKYFSTLPQWKKELYSYEARVKKQPITLAPSSMDAAHKALESLSR